MSIKKKDESQLEQYIVARLAAPKEPFGFLCQSPPPLFLTLYMQLSKGRKIALTYDQQNSTV